MYEAYPEFNILKKGYSNQMLKLYKHIYSCQTVESCCKIDEKRFDWLKDYFCEWNIQKVQFCFIVVINYRL